MVNTGRTRGGSGTSSSYSSRRDSMRIVNKQKNKRVKLRDTMGVIKKKNSLNLGMLNVDGLSASTFEDLKSALVKKSLDVLVVLETKRRHEELGSDINIDGYSLHESRRSDAAEDRGGGGLAWYTRQSDGILFKEYSPAIPDPTLHYVRSERFWLTIDSLSMRTAVCGLYMGCQYHDDHLGSWNDGIYAVLLAEAASLRADGYRICFLGDFNSHIGAAHGVGVEGNHGDINLNGERFLQFLEDGSYIHINGQQDLTTGRWTRQRGSSKSILDFAVISSEHLQSVRTLFIDERGQFGGGSDHNFIFLTLDDMFVRRQRLFKLPVRKSSWNCMDNLDWGPFKEMIKSRLDKRSATALSVDELASLISSVLLSAGESCVGRRPTGGHSGPRLLPRELVAEINLKRSLEAAWKQRVSVAAAPAEEVAVSEAAFVKQKKRVDDLLFSHNNRDRQKIKEICSGNSSKAKKLFWKCVSRKVKQASIISAVVQPVTGVLKCGVDEIKHEVERHFLDVFQGSYEPFDPPAAPDVAVVSSNPDHSYGVNPCPALPSLDSSKQIETDPQGWSNRVFSTCEVRSILGNLTGGKSSGWDSIPNEFLIHSPDILVDWLTVLFNKIKTGGVMPKGFNRGRITLIHKSGLLEVLGNYRPITVIISLSGLFSKLLNSRLTAVVEKHRLLGEEQNGFRKDRQMADNSFILDSVLMKARSKKQKVHLCYIDISKAYDSINRQILWKILKSMGFDGDFLRCLQALYCEDSVDTVVNGLSTRPIYLGRGLRQGCSLSPLLFSLYISRIGSALTSSTEGFPLGGVTFSGLLFADDIVIISRTFRGLESLVNMVKQHCDDLKLTISTKKSNIVTPDDIDQLVLLNADNQVELSLSKVMSYKYLGTETTLLMSTTGSKKQQRCVKTAKSYKFACFHVGRTGPDVVDTVLATWSNIAIPTMLSGCEVIPFSELNIESVERIQSQLAKHALGLTQSTANFCAQTELGLKTFRHLLYQHQLGFFLRVMSLPADRWVRRVLCDHLGGSWVSPYYSYIADIRQKLQLFTIPVSKSSLKLHLNAWFLNQVNELVSSSSLDCVEPISDFSRSNYVCENMACSYIASFKFKNSGLGNRAPRTGRQRTHICSLCGGFLDEVHVAFLCPSLEAFRVAKTDLSCFLNSCKHDGILSTWAAKLYFCGLGKDKKPIGASQYLKRGMELKRVLDEWLRLT